MSKYFKLSIFLCFFLPTISFAQVKDTNNNTFASFICKFINERGLIKCRTVSEGNFLTLVNRADKPVNVMCTWYPFTESGAYKFSRKELIDRRRKKVDFVLIGYGQKPNNPMLYYLVPVSKVKRKMSENALRKCKHTIFRLDAHYSQPYLCAVTFNNNDYGKRKSKLSGGI